MKKYQELIVIIKTYDLMLWSCNHTYAFSGRGRQSFSSEEGAAA
jgi:hypothetical protein